MQFLANTEHRPWPVPDEPWVMRMTWHDLLFLHMPVSVSDVQEHIPSALSVETMNGTAWIGVVPFVMTDVTPRFLPSIPGFSAFPELNVRTYVTDGDHPGVWFFTLDASNSPAVQAARHFFSPVVSTCGHDVQTRGRRDPVPVPAARVRALGQFCSHLSADRA